MQSKINRANNSTKDVMTVRNLDFLYGIVTEF